VTSVLLSGYNCHRKRLIFGVPNTNRVWISFGAPAAVNQGYLLSPAVQSWPLSRQNVGASIEQDVFAISEGAGETLAFIEEVS
jgi:hypothetical protein